MWGGEEQQGVRGKREPLNQQYFPHMENVGDILGPWSIWLD